MKIGEKLSAAKVKAEAQAQRFTAVFTSKDQVAEAALPAIEQALGLRVPEDLSLVTYDADNLNRRLKRDITGMNQPFSMMGQLAAKQLLHLIRGKQEQAAVYGQICKAEFALGSSTSAVLLQSRGSGG
ncbi:substrate-binding family protein [Paenibacillus taihuensis]|uniref:Substrate-binding family protein n=1 Tax=Paenibacillus taihuensis TaxID=1156355 RepID=A0A3D9Q3Y4_9BACL|nr:substrate-binding family protein [Paenibacillus taihuensis]